MRKTAVAMSLVMLLMSAAPAFAARRPSPERTPTVKTSTDKKKKMKKIKKVKKSKKQKKSSYNAY